MKSRKFERLTRRYLLPYLPGFECRGRLVYDRSTELLLRGLCFEPSGFDAQAFYVWVFVQPLFVPCDHVYFSFGDRLRGPRGEGWLLDSEDPKRTFVDIRASLARPRGEFQLLARTLHDVIHLAARLPGAEVDPNSAEAVAYSLVLLGETDAAQQQLRRTVEMIRADDLIVGWLRVIEARCLLIESELLASSDQATRQLMTWVDETRAALKLPPRSPA